VTPTLTGTVTASGATITGATLANPVITLGSDADGDIWYRSSGKIARLAKGTALQVLRMDSGASAPEWGDATVIKSIQRGIVTMDSNPDTVSITTIDADKAVLSLEVSPATDARCLPQAVLADSSITLTQVLTGASLVAWQVVEYN
jgi:hypothetical protein